MNDDSSASDQAKELEKRIEMVAGELAELINRARAEDREGLKDLALSVVRDETLGREDEQPVGGKPRRETAPFNAIGVAMPIGMAGAVMIFLFPPVGLALFGLAALLVMFGVGASFFSRR